jgi:hypothetical protein
MVQAKQMRGALIISFILFWQVITAQPPVPSTWYEGRIQQQVSAVTEVLFHDVVNPPAASRFYAYIILSGYELASQVDLTLPRFHKNFRQYPNIGFTLNGDYDLQFATLYCMLETGKGILPSGLLLEEKQAQLLKDYKAVQSSQRVIDSSVSLAKLVARAIIDYSKSDGYFKLSTRPRYRPGSKASSWAPTPPEYMSAVEPNWNSIRPFFLDSCNQFMPLPATSFDTASASSFIALANEVYRSGNSLNAEQTLIANFWDCNPFAVQFAGHMSVGLKKISPGGHWLGITGIVAGDRQLSFGKTMLLHVVAGCALHDAFISCWDEKYRSNRIRPETVINKYIDEKWKPLIQTPPFPEYTSGHSVISTTVAELLTYLMGDKVSFTDTTEMYIGLPARKFSSFRTAAGEACISRLYGGIHYRDAIENGKEQGMRIAKFIAEKLRLQKL